MTKTFLAQFSSAYRGNVTLIGLSVEPAQATVKKLNESNTTNMLRVIPDELDFVVHAVRESERQKEFPSLPSVPIEVVPNMPDESHANQSSFMISPAEVERAAKAMHPRVLEVWGQVQEWRANQAVNDWKTAERIRNHIHMIAHQNVAEEPLTDAKGKPVLDDHGKPKMRLTSKLKPSDVRQLATAASDIQRMQRLAVGLSTDNIGIDLPRNAGDGSHISKPAEQDTGILFVVEMSKDGKFVRQRPRMIEQNE